MLENNKLIELYSHRISGWKGPTRIIGYNSILITWLSKLNSRIKASFRYSLTSERFGAVGRLFQGPAIFSVKNLFLNFPWSSFIPLSCVLLLVTRERRSAPPLLCLPWGRCTLLSSPPSAFSPPSWTSQLTSDTQVLPLRLLPSWSLFWTHSNNLRSFFYWDTQNCR